MKVLAVSLLRAGDLFMLSPVFRRLHSIHDTAEIHLLINDEFHYVTEVLPDISQVWLFPRRELQDLCGQSNFNLLSPLRRLDEFCRDLNNANFDKVINLTHNRLSSHLMSLVDCENKVGMSFDKLETNVLEKDWFQFLNDRFYFESRIPFHYVDTFYNYSGGERQKDSFELKKDDHSEIHAQQLLPHQHDTILFQLTSSDVKKTWPLPRFRSLMNNLMDQGYKVAVICSPGEATGLQQQLQSELERPEFSFFPCKFSLAHALIERALLLVTLDTSIKHLAVATRTPIIEIALGSSNPYETGVRSIGQYVVYSNEACAPCPHRQDCSRSRQYCAEGLDAEWLTAFTEAVISKNKELVMKLSFISESSVSVVRTELDPFEMWILVPVGPVSRWRREFSFLLRRQAYQRLLLNMQRDEFFEKASPWLFEKLHLMSSKDNVVDVKTHLKMLLKDREGINMIASRHLEDFRIGPNFPPTLSMQEQTDLFRQAADLYESHEYGNTIKRTFLACLEGFKEGSFVTLKRVRQYLRELVEMSEFEIRVLNAFMEWENYERHRVESLLEEGAQKIKSGTRKI